jgi:hypothetical protein
MAGLAFHFEDYEVDVWSGHDLDAWNYAAKIAGDIDKMAVINLSTLPVATPDISLDFNEYASLAAFEAANAGQTITKVVCPWEADTASPTLWGFDHLTDWYVFGPGGGWESPLTGVCIPQAGIASTHAVHAATCVMYHRYKVISLDGC